MRNLKVIRNDNDELIIKTYPEIKQPVIQQPKIKPPDCLICEPNT